MYQNWEGSEAVRMLIFRQFPPDRNYSVGDYVAIFLAARGVHAICRHMGRPEKPNVPAGRCAGRKLRYSP
jgi:hypothetical protein